MAWTAFGFLLFVEIGGLAVGVGLHRSLIAEKQPTARGDTSAVDHEGRGSNEFPVRTSR